MESGNHARSRVIAMKLAKYRLPSGQEAVGFLAEDTLTPLELANGGYRSLADLLEAEEPRQLIEKLADPAAATPRSSVSLRAPIDRQEVWAAGLAGQEPQRPDVAAD